MDGTVRQQPRFGMMTMVAERRNGTWQVVVAQNTNGQWHCVFDSPEAVEAYYYVARLFHEPFENEAAIAKKIEDRAGRRDLKRKPADPIDEIVPWRHATDIGVVLPPRS